MTLKKNNINLIWFFFLLSCNKGLLKLTGKGSIRINVHLFVGSSRILPFIAFVIFMTRTIDTIRNWILASWEPDCKINGGNSVERKRVNIRICEWVNVGSHNREENKDRKKWRLNKCTRKKQRIFRGVRTDWYGLKYRCDQTLILLHEKIDYSLLTGEVGRGCAVGKFRSFGIDRRRKNRYRSLGLVVRFQMRTKTQCVSRYNSSVSNSVHREQR